MKDLTNRKVLVTDDVHSMREALRMLLHELGFKDIEVAEHGKDALQKAVSVENTEPFELFFCDINMPEMNGIELVGALRSIETYKKTPIVMVSTENEVSVILDCVSAGANNYILKPFEKKTVIAQLDQLSKQLNT